MRTFLPFLSLLIITTAVHAQEGVLDASFGTGGIVHTYFSGHGQGKGVLVQPDGKIVVAGSTLFSMGQYVLARYKPDGSLDSSFGTNGQVLQPSTGYSDAGEAVALQADGRIIIAGYSFNGSSNDEYTLIRYKNNGEVDSTFGINGMSMHDVGNATDRIYGLVIQPDGKILAVGESSSPVSPYNYSVVTARYKTNGDLDSTFGYNGFLAGSFPAYNINGRDIILQPDGKILVCGEYGPIMGPTNFCAARINSDGTPDATFGTGGLLYTDINSSSYAAALVLQPDGKVVVAGTSNGSRGYLAMVRYKSDGVIDSSFGTNGIVEAAPGNTSYGCDIGIQADGKLLMSGYATSSTTSYLNFIVARFKTDGSSDSTFGTDGYTFSDVGAAAYGNSLAIQPDGKVLVFGNTGIDDGFVLARYGNDPSGIQPISVSIFSDMAVFPNPSQNAPFISFSLNKPATVSISLFDMRGRLLSRSSGSVPAGRITQPLNWNNSFPAGEYIIQLSSGTERKSLVLSKE